MKKNIASYTTILLILLNICLIILLFNCTDCRLEIFCLSCIENDDLISIIATIFAAIAALYAVKSFAKSNEIKSAEFYLTLKARFKENESFTLIRELLYESAKNKEDEEKKENIKKTTRIKRIDYVGFMEEINILLNKKLISKDDVYLSFGQYILECDESEAFWLDLTKNDPLWKNFRDLVNKMKKIKNK